MYDASVSLYSPVTGSPPRSVDLRASDPPSPRPALETLDPAGTSNRSETAPDPDIVVVGAVPPPAVPDVAVVDSVPPLAVRVQLFADRRNVVADMEDALWHYMLILCDMLQIPIIRYLMLRFLLTFIFLTV